MAEKCKGVKADGNQCERNAQEGTEYCFQHQPAEAVVAQEIIIEGKPYVKQIVRYLSTSGQYDEGAEPVWAVDQYLDAWYQQGYVLKDTHYMGQNPEGIGVLYVLVLKDA